MLCEFCTLILCLYNICTVCTYVPTRKLQFHIKRVQQMTSNLQSKFKSVPMEQFTSMSAVEIKYMTVKSLQVEEINGFKYKRTPFQRCLLQCGNKLMYPKPKALKMAGHEQNTHTTTTTYLVHTTERATLLEVPPRTH